MRVHRVLAVAVVFLFLVGLGFSQTQGRTERFSFPIIGTGEYAASCGDFDLLSDFVLLARGVVLLDKDGQPVREVDRYKIIGQGVLYNSTDPDLFLLSGPGEIEIDHIDYGNGILSITGIPFKFKVPGYGSIFYETGRIVIDGTNLYTGEWLSNTGHNQWADADIEALCKLLTP